MFRSRCRADVPFPVPHSPLPNREANERRDEKRAEALEVQQAKWSSEEWERFEKKQEKKRNPKGSPQWLVKEVVRYLSQAQQLPEEEVTEKLIELGDMDFLVKGAESIGEQRCGTATMVIAAVRALALYLDPESAVMFAGSEAAKG